MKWTKKWSVLILFVGVAAALIRLPGLEHRPMHGDEAVHAIKFGELLEKGEYIYDREEYHGPTLNYFTLIPSWLGGEEKLAEVNEFTLRIVPVFFGVGLILLLLLAVDGLGPVASVFAGVLTAFSPAMVFYSRYYIAEMLLVFFTFGVIVCGYRYVQNRSFKWALLTGLFAGLMYATKETCIIAYFSMLGAMVFTSMMQHKKASAADAVVRIKPVHVVAGVLAAAAVSVLFYSSFFTNPAGVSDSVLSYSGYFSRGVGDSVHIKPWYYYFDILTWMEGFERLTWNEDFIVVMAGFGFILLMRRKEVSFGNMGFLRFLAFYTLIMTIVYSAIPYKTPWSMLSFLHGMILLAGVGTAVLVKWAEARWEKVVVWIFLGLFGLLIPVFQAYLGSYRYYTSPSNPYVYAHPTKDVFEITERIGDIAGVHPDGHDMYIQVVCRGDDYWPLPWYLRDFNKVGWWNDVDEDAESAEVIIASADIEESLMRKLYELPEPGEKHLYVPLFDGYMELRPEVELRGYVRKELWDSYVQSKSIQSNE